MGKIIIEGIACEPHTYEDIEYSYGGRVICAISSALNAIDKCIDLSKYHRISDDIISQVTSIYNPTSRYIACISDTYGSTICCQLHVRHSGETQGFHSLGFAAYFFRHNAIDECPQNPFEGLMSHIINSTTPITDVDAIAAIFKRLPKLFNRMKRMEQHIKDISPMTAGIEWLTLLSHCDSAAVADIVDMIMLDPLKYANMSSFVKLDTTDFAEYADDFTDHRQLIHAIQFIAKGAL